MPSVARPKNFFNYNIYKTHLISAIDSSVRPIRIEM